MSSRFPRFGIVCIGAGVILIGIVCLLVALMLVRPEWPFLTDGAQALGRVTGNRMHTETTRGGTQTLYDLRYIFQDASQVAHTGQDSVRANIWARAKPGDPLAIQYLMADPAKNRIGRGDSTGVLGAVITASVGTVFVALGIFLLASRKFEFRYRNPKYQIPNPKKDGD